MSFQCISPQKTSFFFELFLPVMREICKESIDEQKKNTEHMLQKNEIIMQDMLRTMNVYVRYSTLKSPKKKPKRMIKKNRI